MPSRMTVSDMQAVPVRGAGTRQGKRSRLADLGLLVSVMGLLAGCATPLPQTVPLAPAIPARAPVSPVPAKPALPSPAEVPPPVPAPAAADVPGPTVAPADDRLAVLQSWITQQQRLYQVAAPLLLRNTPLCPLLARKILGFTAKNAYSFSSDFVPVAQSGLGLGEQLQVMSVLPDSGAAKAGIRSGDLLLAAGDQTLAQGPDAERVAGSMVSDAIEGNTALDVTVWRKGDTESSIVDVPLTPACAMVIDLGNTEEVNSYADGRHVMVTRGMLGFVRSDDELAAVMAHELASNILSPTLRPAQSVVIERLHSLNAVTQAAPEGNVLAPATVQQDSAADRLALYMLARAGYRLDAVAPFWLRLASTYPASIANSHTALHAPIGERLAVIERVIGDIRQQQQQGKPVVP